jgi:hypothetical protein
LVFDCVLVFANLQGMIHRLDSRQRVHACCSGSTGHYFPCSADSLFSSLCTFGRSLLLLRYKHYNACLLYHLAFHTQRTAPCLCIFLSFAFDNLITLLCWILCTFFCTDSAFRCNQRKDSARKEYKRPGKDTLCKNGAKDTIDLSF